jgi:hypothetical protein
MYQKLALLILSVLLAPLCYCQLHYRDITCAEALQMAKQSQKIIFLQYESATCNECNEVADKGIGAQEVSERIQSAFIPIKITSTSPDRQQVGKEYNILNGFGSLFIDWNGNLLHSFHITTTRSREYADQITIALNKAGEALKLNELENTYKQFGGSAILEMVLLKRQSLPLRYDKELDEYVNLLPADSFTAARTLKFLIRMAPVLESNADKMMRSDITAFEQAWNQLTTVEQNLANSRIISRSVIKAIEAKDEAFAHRVAAYSVTSIHATGVLADRQRSLPLMHYYKGVKDTANYLKTAIEYYNRYIMTIDYERIKKRDSVAFRQALDRATPIDTIINGITIHRKTVLRGPTYASYVSSDLSNAAKALIEMSDDRVIYTLAYDWSKRALELAETPGDLEVHSLICHKLGYEQEAQQAEEKRDVLRKRIGLPAVPVNEGLR